VVALLIPRIPATLREWAYAGFTFDRIAAVASHLLVRDAVGVSGLVRVHDRGGALGRDDGDVPDPEVA
jgi:hypothetical protein